jgi:Ser/Thr protein kinase RdoA (MazF antagonist)
VQSLLARVWGVEGALTPLSRGHTNESFLVGERWVARRSFAAKPVEELDREAALLRALPAEARAPRLIPTRTGEPRAWDGSRWVQLFERLSGAPPSPSPETARGALRHLALVHRALAAMPCHADKRRDDPLEWLRERHRQIAAHGATGLPGWVTAALPVALTRIDRLLGEATRFAPLGRTQWLHGDFHLGNLLVDNGEISGVVDFDDCGHGAPLVEAAFASFAVSRDATVEDRFAWDPSLWNDAREAYGVPFPSSDALAELFAADQVLIHLAAAQRGLWPLAPGIGFLGCWRTLVSGR